MIRHRLDDTTWQKIYLCLKATPGIYVGHEDQCRLFVDAVHWVMRTGAQWRDLPEEFGKWNTIFKRFARWSDKGIWNNLHESFIAEPDMEWLLIDSTVSSQKIVAEQKINEKSSKSYRSSNKGIISLGETAK